MPRSWRRLLNPDDHHIPPHPPVHVELDASTIASRIATEFVSQLSIAQPTDCRHFLREQQYRLGKSHGRVIQHDRHRGNDAVRAVNLNVNTFNGVSNIDNPLNGTGPAFTSSDGWGMGV